MNDLYQLSLRAAAAKTPEEHARLMADLERSIDSYERTLGGFRRPQSGPWFAWYPVRLGALGIGRWAWLKRVWRFRGVHRWDVIYQDLDWVESLGKERVDVRLFAPYLRP